MKDDTCVKLNIVTNILAEINGLNFMGEENEGLPIQALHLPRISFLIKPAAVLKVYKLNGVISAVL